MNILSDVSKLVDTVNRRYSIRSGMRPLVVEATLETLSICSVTRCLGACSQYQGDCTAVRMCKTDCTCELLTIGLPYPSNELTSDVGCDSFILDRYLKDGGA
jgi:hypothetical protein